MEFIVRSSVVWLGLFALAFVNGALREILMKKVLEINNITAHQLSCLTGVILWFSFVYIVWNFINITSMRQAVGVGIFWFVMTVVAETFLINKLMSKMSWSQIADTYNIFRRDLWGLVLLAVGFIPVVIYLIYRHKSA